MGHFRWAQPLRAESLLCAVRETVLIGFAGWLLVVVRGSLVRLVVRESAGFGDDFPVDLLSRHGGVSAEAILVIQGC